VVFNLTNTTYSEGVINSNANAGSYTLMIKPNTTATIQQNTATSIFKVNGADKIIIDGSNSGGTDQSLSITNTNASTSAAVVLVNASASDGATGNTIKE
jgi:hypothetical protein